MDYRAVLEQCDDAAMAAAVGSALADLFKADAKLLAVDSSERSIAARLARHLEAYFPDFDVDVEYNRMGDAPKQVAWSDKLERVYPDIIVHVRRTNTNILAFELKKDSNAEPKDDDILKLRAYRRELGYRHALFLRFGVGDGAGTISECEWVHA